MSAAVIETIGSKDLTQFAHDQIVAQIQSHFSGHERARIVDAVLKVMDWVTTFASRGPDSGVDIFAWCGSPGLDQQFLCVQGKLQTSSCTVTIYHMLQGLMQTFEGCRVCMLMRLQQSRSSGSQTEVLFTIGRTVNWLKQFTVNISDFLLIFCKNCP